MRNKSFNRFVCVMLSIFIVMSGIVYAEENIDEVKCPDIVGNKYEAQLREWIDNGFIKGNPDGTFKPYNTVTRAEFMAIVNRLFGFADAAEIDFADVLKEDWFYEDAAKAVKAGYMQGYDGKLFPLDPISRQAFATVLARLTGGEAAADDTVINSLTDGKSIPEWSKAAISTSMNKGYFNGLIKVLIVLIENATLKAKNAVIGEKPGNYPQSAVYELLYAIANAQAVVADADGTQKEVDSAVTTLNAAIAAFEAAVITAPETFIISVLKNPADGGEVTVTGAVYSMNIFKAGDEVTIIATPNEGYEFENWTGNIVQKAITTNPYTFAMPAKNVSLTANFADIKAPVIVLTGDATMNLTAGDTFTDPGVTAADNLDGDITDEVVVGGDTVDTNTAGTYVITYNVSDAAGNSAVEVTRTVVVKAAPDTTAPKLTSVSPGEGEVVLEYEETFKLIVDAYDEGKLFELEIDHSMENTLQEFSIYADENNPYGSPEDQAAFSAAGVAVTYDDETQKWEIDFGPIVTSKIVQNHGITFYLVIKDMAGNSWGSMYDVTDENTFEYTVTQ